MQNLFMNLGQKIKFQRKKKNMTQAELAKKIGVSSNQVINHYETGFRTPSLSMLRKIAAALDCDLLIELKEKKSSNQKPSI